MRNTRRLIVLRVVCAIGGIVVVVSVLEVVLRQLPVHERTYYVPETASNPISQFAPDRDFLWSRDWDLAAANVVDVNNIGFVSNTDYLPSDPRPLVAVIGDSYVEALMVSYERTCAGLLKEQLSPEYRVYSFGQSGAPLSQYLAVARYVKDTFSPSILWFVIVGNDYDESLIRYKDVPGFHYFVEDQESDRLSLSLILYEPRSGLLWSALSTAKNWAYTSALFRYFYLNLRVVELVRGIFYGYGEGSSTTDGPETRILWSKRAVDVFLEAVRDSMGLEPPRIGFVMDGGRELLYEHNYDHIDTYYDGILRKYFIQNATEIGFRVIDMEPVFAAHYATHGARFDWYRDFHWNALGHRLCYEEVAGVLQSQILVSDE